LDSGSADIQVSQKVLMSHKFNFVPESFFISLIMVWDVSLDAPKTSTNLDIGQVYEMPPEPLGAEFQAGLLVDSVRITDTPKNRKLYCQIIIGLIFIFYLRV
jgi:hypothetical protein